MIINTLQDEKKFETFFGAIDTDHDGKVDIRELVCGFSILLDGSSDDKLLSIIPLFEIFHSLTSIQLLSEYLIEMVITSFKRTS